MPTYDYICTSCGNSWEFEQRIVEDPIKDCPRCGAATAKRQISNGAGFILKGGGWYADGYGSSKGSSNESSTEAKSTKSETKQNRRRPSPTTAAKGPRDRMAEARRPRPPPRLRRPPKRARLRFSAHGRWLAPPLRQNSGFVRTHGSVLGSGPQNRGWGPVPDLLRRGGGSAPGNKTARTPSSSS